MSYPPPPQGPYPPPPYQPNPQLPPYPGVKRPWWKALWFVALVALIVGVAIGAGGASGSKKNAASTPGPTVTATATATTTRTLPGRTVTAHPVITKVVKTKTHTQTVTYTPPPPHQYGEGTYIVGRDIRAGTYSSSGSSDCYWARLKDLHGSVYSIIANHLGDGSQYVEIDSSDKAFEVSGSCTFGKA